MRIMFTTIASAACLVAAATTAGSAGEARAPASYMYILMVNMIGPAANSVSKAAEAQALNDQEWERVKQMTARLNESAAAVSAGGTTAEDIRRANSSEWKAWAVQFGQAVSRVANAAERKDRTALVAANDDLVAACEGCHVAFPQAAR
jgi:cytochrome c556